MNFHYFQTKRQSLSCAYQQYLPHFPTFTPVSEQPNIVKQKTKKENIQKLDGQSLYKDQESLTPKLKNPLGTSHG